jgi:hypothetical protein
MDISVLCTLGNTVNLIFYKYLAALLLSIRPCYYLFFVYSQSKSLDSNSFNTTMLLFIRYITVQVARHKTLIGLIKTSHTCGKVALMPLCLSHLFVGRHFFDDYLLYEN